MTAIEWAVGIVVIAKYLFLIGCAGMLGLAFWQLAGFILEDLKLPTTIKWRLLLVALIITIAVAVPVGVGKLQIASLAQ